MFFLFPRLLSRSRVTIRHFSFPQSPLRLFLASNWRTRAFIEIAYICPFALSIESNSKGRNDAFTCTFLARINELDKVYFSANKYETPR